MSKARRDDRGEMFPTQAMKRRVPLIDAIQSGEAKQWVESFNDVSGELEALQRKAADYIAEHCEETSPLEYKHNRTAHAPGGIRTFKVPNNVDETVFDAFELTSCINALLHAIEPLRRAADDSPQADQALWTVVRHAMNVGIARAQIYARGFEHAARVGRDKIEHAPTMRAKSNKATNRTRAENAIADARKLNPSCKYLTPIKRTAAEKLNISLRTLNRWLK